MNILVTIHDGGTGAWIKTLDLPDLETVHLNMEPGNVEIIGEHPADTYLRAGMVTPLPPRPAGAGWSFDPAAEQWLRSEAHRLADLEARRASASMTRANLVLAAVTARIIPEADAAAAARGEITASIQALIDQMPTERQLEAVVRWAASIVIDRTNPILTALAASMGLTDAQLDQLFGVTPPPTEE